MTATTGLSSLLAITRTIQVEEYGNMRVMAVHWERRSVTVRLELNDGSREPLSFWELAFAGALEYSFSGVYNCGLNIHRNNHPMVAQYTQPREALHFSQRAVDPIRAVGQLWQVHRDLVDDWIDFDRYMNRELSLAELLATGSGLLASGPRFLIRSYAKV